MTPRRSSDTEWTAELVLAELSPGMRMRFLFDTAKAATWIAPGELEKLFAEPSYEARMAAFCILDFQARKLLGDLELRDTYLRHHDRIDDWGMVDRAAPRVVGATLAGGPYDLLHELAASPDPYRRRTAMTAPLWFVKYGDDRDVEAGLTVAEALHADPDPLVHKPVGIYLAYAGERLPDRLTEFLEQHGDAMPRAAYRIAIRKRKQKDSG
jgi:3-methyladenine DNA glycosylase AlkD